MDIQFAMPTNFGLAADESVQDLGVDSLVPAAGQEHVFRIPGVSPICAGDCGCGDCDGGYDPYFPPTRQDVIPLPGGCIFCQDPIPPGGGDPPDPPNDPVKRICGPDVTASLVELINNITSQMSKLGVTMSLDNIRSLFKTPVMDFKVKQPAPSGGEGKGAPDCPTKCPQSVTLCGKCLDASVVGNIVFGAMLGKNGNLKRTALAGSNYADEKVVALGKYQQIVSSVQVFLGGSEYALENPHDQYAVGEGHDLVQPTGIDDMDSYDDGESMDQDSEDVKDTDVADPTSIEELCDALGKGSPQPSREQCEPCPSSAPHRYKVPKLGKELVEEERISKSGRKYSVYHYHVFATEGE